MNEIYILLENLSLIEKFEDALNVLYEHVLQLQKKQDFKSIDEFMLEFVKYNIHIKIYVGFLAVTKGNKNKFNNRELLIAGAYISARRSIKDEKRIETILNGF